MTQNIRTLFVLLTWPLVVMAAPSEPMLIFPASNTVNVADSPPLKVRAGETSGGSVTVRYYGRLAKSPGPDFTVVVMPDTQCYTGEISGGKKEMMIAQTEWAITNREARNVAYVTQLGDISNNGDTPSYVFQWYNATNAMYRLEDPVRTLIEDGMPYGVAVGNHEMTPNGAADSGSTTNYNKYFGVDRFLGRSYYGGNYGANNNNHVDFFSASGLDFMAIYFEYDTTMNAAVLAWANALLQDNPTRRAILVTHYFGTATTPSTHSTQGAAIYNALKSHPNLFLMLGGHVCGPDQMGEGSRSDTYNGNTVWTLISDYQCRVNGGNGMMRLMEFSPSNNVVVVQTYSPWTGEYETDENSEFYLPYSMPPSVASAESFVELHTEPGVASNGLASFTWPGLLPYRTYEWYVTVTDQNNNTVTGPTWSFTTAPENPRHDVAAGQLDVAQIPGFSGSDENENCAVTQTFSVNDFRAGSFNRADYNVQVGPDGSGNAARGILLSSIAQNGRNNYGTNLFATSAIQANASGIYRICTFSSPNTNGDADVYGYEYNMNVGGAWFPFETWLGGLVRNDPGTNGGVWNLFTGSEDLSLGTHITSAGGGKAIVNLTSLGIDSRTDGVLLVNHARDEANFALAQVNTNDGTWNVFVKDNSTVTAGDYEQDPFAFVFVPRTQTAVVSGRFLADGSIDMHSGESPLFTVTVLGTGRWELKIVGRTPSEGTLIISAEGGMTYNLDNIVSYQVNADGDGWEIQSRDTPKNALQTPTAKEPIVSFVYVPALRPGIAISPADNLVTIESGVASTFTIMLDKQPSADVDITFASSDTSEGTVSPASLTFTTNDWHVPRTVTVTGVDDSVLDGNIIYNVTVGVSSTDSRYNTLQIAPLSVVNLDNEPQLTVSSNEVSYGTGMPGIALDGQATLVDPATMSYGGASLTVTLTANATADDRLEIRNIGTGNGQISVAGNVIRYGGTIIGTFAGGTGTASLVVTFNSAATPSAVQALLRAVTFSNASGNPSLNVRNVSLVLVKADGVTVTAETSVRVRLLRIALFQQGFDHGYGLYTNAIDCELSAAKSNQSLTLGHSGNNAIWMDAPNLNTTEAAEALLCFGGISGSGPGQIPTNAIIVSADLIITIPPEVSNSPGDASPLYRMLAPWDPDSITWNNAGYGGEGLIPNGVHARSNYYSFFGLPGGEAETGRGTITLGVTEDVKAWVNGGEANYGWLMPGWQPPAASGPRTDGTAFASCEWMNNMAERPLLRVLWLPENTPSAGFRQDVSGYVGTHDTRIRQGTPGTNYSTIESMYCEWEPSDLSELLLRFDDIIGDGAGQVTPGARIEAAVLDLAGTVADSMGDGGRFFRLLQPWQEATSTWNTWGNGIQTNGIEAAVTPTAVAGSASLTPNVQAAYLSFDLTPDVQTWAYGSPNYGWVIMPWPNGADAWGIGTSEAAKAVDRPQLRVFYTTPGSGDISMLSPVRTSTQVQVRFTGIVGTAVTVQRTGVLGGAWTTLGSAVVDQDGIGTFIDAAPLQNAAFYRVRFP